MRLTNVEEFLTEKGKVKSDIRTQLQRIVRGKPELFSKAVEVSPNIYEIAIHNSKNASEPQTVYVRFEVKVSERSASELAPKSKKSKGATTEDIEVE